jgi:hypothetical protein
MHATTTCSATSKRRLQDDLHFLGMVGVKVITLVAESPSIVRWRSPSTPFLGASAKAKELLSTSHLLPGFRDLTSDGVCGLSPRDKFVNDACLSRAAKIPEAMNRVIQKSSSGKGMSIRRLKHSFKSFQNGLRYDDWDLSNFSKVRPVDHLYGGSLLTRAVQYTRVY